MNKIEITSISPDVYFQKGFDKQGCYRSSCRDECCVYGCDVDKVAYQLIFENRRAIETILGRELEDCFEDHWSYEEDFLGGNAIRSTVSERGYCTFHVPSGKGCALYQLVSEAGVSRRLVPSVCRLYPLTWVDGVLRLADDFEEFKGACNCNGDDASMQSLFETQRREIEDIFTIPAPAPARSR